MKTPTALLAFFLFLLFAFTTRAGDVYDSDGDFLINGGTYTLSPPEGYAAIVAAAFRKGDSDACSLGVIQLEGPIRGWPVTIRSDVRGLYISTTYQLFLSFAYISPNVCTNSSDWIVIWSPPVGEPVMAGDAREFGDSVVSGWFYVRPYDFANKQYKLVFCRDQTTGECGNIGLYIDSHGLRRLVVTDREPLVFKFDKVQESSFASQSDPLMVV